MEIKRVTADYRKEQWVEIIRECKASGQSNKHWCEENHVDIKSFYYWQTKFRKAASQMLVKENAPQLVPLKLPETVGSRAVIIRKNGCEIEIPEGTSQSFMENVLNALNQIC